MNGPQKRICLCFLSILLANLSACYTFIDTSRKGLQQMWLEWVRDGAIGKNIHECKARTVRTHACAVFKGSDTPLSSRLLPNGNTEVEYDSSLIQGRCRYFYEYETDTGLIVGFRFEESEQYGCRVTGA